jgi:hypothetical protein
MSLLFTSMQNLREGLLYREFLYSHILKMKNYIQHLSMKLQVSQTNN